jgi:Family of unknown function (DUF5996)
MTAEPSTSLWPELPFEPWQETLHLLHMTTQMVGKVSLRLNPFLNEWWHVALQLTSTGLTSGPIIHHRGVFHLELNFDAHELLIRTSDGGRRALALPGKSVAGIYAGLMEQLSGLGISVEINTIPDESATRTRFEEDERIPDFDFDAVRRWWELILRARNVMAVHRSSFVGKSSPIQFWWGSFDLNYTRFSGRLNQPAPGMNRMMRIAEDQENISAGLWPGSAEVGGPAFYAYLFPANPLMRQAKIPEPGFFEPNLGEFILRLEDVRQTSDPAATVLRFLESTYEACADLANWDRQMLEQPVPPLPPLRHHPHPAV